MGGTVLLPGPGHAACLPSSADSLTNCGIFTPESDSIVVNRYAVDNHLFNRHFQLGLFTTASTPVTMKDLAWSVDGVSWSNFSKNTVIAGNSSTNLGYTEIVSLSGVIGNDFQIRYTIPGVGPGVFAEGDYLSSQLFSNRDHSTGLTWDANTMAAVPVLNSRPGNLYALVQRDHQDAPSSVPGPLALLGVMAGLRTARQLRRQGAMA